MGPSRRRWRERLGAQLVLVSVVLLMTACSSSDVSPALRTRALELAGSGRCSQALPLLGQIVSAQGSDVAALMAEGECDVQLLKYGLAVRHLQAAVRLSADATDLQDLAQAQWDEGLQAQALYNLKYASRVAVNAQQLVSIARNLWSYTDPGVALSVLQRVPVGQRGYLWYDSAGDVETALQDYSQASSDFAEGVVIAPAADRWMVEQDWGDSYWGNGDYPQALTEYEAALQAGARDPAYVNNQIGLCNVQLGKFLVAQSAFQAAVSDDPSPVLLGSIGDSLIQVDLRLNDVPSARNMEQKLLSDKNVPTSAKHVAQALMSR